MAIESTWKRLGREHADSLSDQIMSASLHFLGISQEAYEEGLEDDDYDHLMDKTIELAAEAMEGFNQAWFYPVIRE